MLTLFRILYAHTVENFTLATTLTHKKCYYLRVHSLLHVKLLLLQCFVDISDYLNVKYVAFEVPSASSFACSLRSNNVALVSWNISRMTGISRFRKK